MGTFNSKPESKILEETHKLKTNKEKILEAIEKNKLISYLNLSDLDLIDEDFEGIVIPSYINNIYLSYNKLTKVPKLHEEISSFDLDNNLIEKIENLPKKLKNLDISNNKIKELPDLYDYYNLKIIYADNNLIEKIERLPKYLENAYFNNNLITEIPKLPKSLIHLSLQKNKITKESDIKSLKFNNKISLIGNPIFDEINKIRIDTFDASLIESRFFDILNQGNNEKENIEFKVLTLKKGTVLFRTSKGLDNGFKDMFVGYKKDDKYIISPEHESYFFLHPFNITYGNTTIMYVLTSDVKIIMGIKPGNNYSKKNIHSTFGQKCETKEYKSKIKNIFNHTCINDEFIKKHPDILGWIAPDISNDSFKYDENFDVFNPKGVGSYISYYENSEGMITRPEVSIYPFKQRSLVDIETSIDNFSFDKVYENMDSYNYKPILVIEDNRDVKVYRKYIDTFLSNKGYKDSSGTYHMKRREDGTYFIEEYI